jgi:hypothetical protein
VGVWKILVLFIIAFGNSETRNGKKVLGREGFEFNFAFGNSQSGNQRYWGWCGRLEFLLAFESLRELPRSVFKNMHFSVGRLLLQEALRRHRTYIFYRLKKLTITGGSKTNIKEPQRHLATIVTSFLKY